MILYSPVIIFGTGLSSIIGNEFVQSLDWSTFLANLDPRLINVWNKWMIGFNPIIEYLFLGGFLLSLFFYRKVSNQKLPLQIFLVLAIAILLAAAASHTNAKNMALPGSILFDVRRGRIGMAGQICSCAAV